MMDEKERKKIAFLGWGAHTLPAYRAQLKLLAQDYDITLFSEVYISSEFRIKEYKIKTVPPWKMHRRIRELWFGLMIFFNQLIRPMDIVHTHSTFPSGLAGVLIGKIFKKPIIVSLDAAEGVGLKNIGFGDLLHKKRTKVNSFVLRHATIVTCLTKYHKNLIKQNLTTDKEILVVPRGVDVSQFKYSKNELHSPIRFLNVGYIHTVKDQETLLRCFSILSKKMPCHLTHLGQDYLNGSMNKLCDELGINNYVSFKGHVQHEQIQHYYNDADVLLHTSLYESQAVVVAEALASGVLVCGTHVGLMADLSNLCCLTVAPGDYRGLAEKVIQLLNDKVAMEQLHLNGRKWAEEHDLTWTKNKYKELYDTF